MLELDPPVDDNQFGFRQEFRTRKAMLALNVLIQKCYDQSYDAYACSN